MSEKLYRALQKGEIIESKDITVATSERDELREVPSNWAGREHVCDFIILRPVTLPRVGWLPIGEKKEFEDGTLYGRLANGKMTVVYPVESCVRTHYLPPQPVLDGVKEGRTFEDECKSLRDEMDMMAGAHKRHIASRDARISELEATGASLTKENLDLENRVDELEESIKRTDEQSDALMAHKDKEISELRESLRKAEESNKQSPAWQELATFEGEWCNVDCVAKIGKKSDAQGFQSKLAAIDFGYTHYYIVPEFKPDNRAKIAELENAINALSMLPFPNVKYMNELKSELAKLKDEQGHARDLAKRIG